MDLEAIRAAMQAAQTKYEGVLAAIGANEPTDEQQAELDAAEAEFTKQVAAYDRAAKAADMRATLGGSSGRKTEPGRVAQVTGGDRVIDKDERRGFQSAAEFGRAVARACQPGARNVDERLLTPQDAAATTFSRENVGADGGYAVPPAFADTIQKILWSEGSLLAATNPTPTESNSVLEPTSEWTPWGTTGIQANWVGEAGVIAQSKVVLKQTTTQLHKLAVMCPATEELLEDAPRLERHLSEDAAQAIRWRSDDAIANGTGIAKPFGFATSAAMIEQAKESGQAADTIVAANIFNMISRLLPGSYQRAVWIVSPSAQAALHSMVIGGSPALLPINQPMTAGSLPFTLLGRPIINSTVCDVLGDAGDIYLADLAGGYRAFVKSSGIKFATSMHLFFDYDEMAFRWTFRLGGRPWLSAVVTDNNSFTMSHFVKLAARA